MAHRGAVTDLIAKTTVQNLDSVEAFDVEQMGGKGKRDRERKETDGLHAARTSLLRP